MRTIRFRNRPAIDAVRKPWLWIPLTASLLSRHSQRVSRHPHVVRKGRVPFVHTVYLFGDALCPIADHDFAHAELQHVVSPGVDETWCQGDAESGPAESQIVPDQIVRRHALGANRQGQAQPLDPGSRMRQPRSRPCIDPELHRTESCLA